MKRTKDHGLVMTTEHIDYSDMTTEGTVTIQRNAEGELEIYTEGFEFQTPGTCRQTSAKGVAWARDVLDAALKAHLLLPGGVSQLTIGCD